MNNQPHGPPGFDRERELEETRSRDELRREEMHRQRALQQQEDLSIHREREQNERIERERQERERQIRDQFPPAPPHQNNTGSLPLHQPVASRLPGAIHSPGGLLANHGGAPPPHPGSLGAPNGPGNAFGGPLQSEASRTIPPNPQAATGQLQNQQSFGPSLLHHNPINAPAAFGGPLQQQQQQQQEAVSRLQQLPFGAPIAPGHQMPGAPALGQGGQQPILNDALSYLDQVKVQFADQPDVYNRFLDIMKDFKSQAIDTPGVINRVSELFAGHPNLIQGFNTFLPPGYRIECGAGNDPNTIRVTTPMGTTVQSITGAGRALPETQIVQGGVGGGYYGTQRPGNNWQQPQHTIESPEGHFSPQNQSVSLGYGQNQPQHQGYESSHAAAAATHQQQQRGVVQLTNAAQNLMGHPPRNTQTPTPGAQAGVNGGQQPGLEKRGPVEFNHAISYVNKIKNRFQDKPEIYKNFLEILQTYQRESKPIQDVYAQVTSLFDSAPDLLEDFKQFLPESAAHAKAAAAAKAAEEAGLSQTPQNRGEAKMPPVHNFPVPASSSKENKKRPRNTATNIPGPQGNMLPEGPGRVIGQGGPSNKRTKLNHKPNAPDAPAVSPTLTPILPEPLPPTSTSGASSEELAFFDRIKKHIANKTSMNEFLKLCNLFSQDLIDRNVLVHKVSSFIGGSVVLMDEFKVFVGYKEVDEIEVDNRPRAPSDKVVLSNCRGLGPSYRLLPKRERLKPCSGRDEMCLSVLNDDWASHPTWASEDSGFVAHRKNIFEESLHRIEEERHDYDFNIEANAKVIQLLEPIGQSILGMAPAERDAFKIPIGLGGQSQAIYKRVLKKVYGERGPEVVTDLFKDPCAVLPIVLARLKQKDEEWRFTQREWEKVWHAQTEAMYWKSLDHMGIQVKSSDKKNFAAKHLVDAIKTKRAEQKAQRSTKGKASRWQFVHGFVDRDVVLDLLQFMVIYATNASQHNTAERRRISDFFERFVTTFFGLPEDQVRERLDQVNRGSSEEDSEDPSHSEIPSSRGRPRPAKKNLLKDAAAGAHAARNGTKVRAQNQDSATGSKESTPDLESFAEDDARDAAEDQHINKVSTERWAIIAPFKNGESLEDVDSKGDRPMKRDWYKLYGNQTIFVFFSIFQTLYRRLLELKQCESEAVKEGLRAMQPKPAKDVGLLNEKDEIYMPPPGETYYAQALLLIKDFINGDVEEVAYHNWLRRNYLHKGWQVYTIADLLKSLCRLGAICSSVDSKEKTPDLISQFYQNRLSEETSINAEINVRKQADKYVKEGELFLIQWFPTRNEATMRIIVKEENETTLDMDDMELKERWEYYTASFSRVEPTEGVPRHSAKKDSRHVTGPVLTKNRSPEYETDQPPDSVSFKENLTYKLDFYTLKMIYDPFLSDSLVWTDKTLGTDPESGESAARERLRKSENSRRYKFEEKFGYAPKWTVGLSEENISKVKAKFNDWVHNGVLPNGNHVQPRLRAETSASQDWVNAPRPAGSEWYLESTDVEMTDE